MKVYYNIVNGHKCTKECKIKECGVGSNVCQDCENNIGHTFAGEKVTYQLDGKIKSLYKLYVDCKIGDNLDNFE